MPAAPRSSRSRPRSETRMPRLGRPTSAASRRWSSVHPPGKRSSRRAGAHRQLRPWRTRRAAARCRRTGSRSSRHQRGCTRSTSDAAGPARCSVSRPRLRGRAFRPGPPLRERLFTLGFRVRQWAALVSECDLLVRRLLVGDTPRAGPEVDSLRMMRDERGGRLLRRERVAARERDPDRLHVEQVVDLLVLGLLGDRRVAPGVAAALMGADAEVAAHLLVQPLGYALRGLHRQAVDEVALAVLTLGFQLLAKL